MPFTQEQSIVDETAGVFGKYVSTYLSATGQVTAHLFNVDDELVAHVSFAPGYDISTATDRYYAELQQFAQEKGYLGKLRLIFAEQSSWV